MKPVYYRNGAAYAITRDALRAGSSLKPDHTGAFVINEPFVSIDTAEDFVTPRNIR